MNSDTDTSETNKRKHKFRAKKNKNQLFIPQTLLKRMNSERLYTNGDERPEHDVINARDHNLESKELTLYDCLQNEYGFFALLRIYISIDDNIYIYNGVQCDDDK